MVSALISKLTGLGLSPGWGYCVVFLGKTLTRQLSQCFSSPRSINEYRGIRWVRHIWPSIPSREEAEIILVPDWLLGVYADFTCLD